MVKSKTPVKIEEVTKIKMAKTYQAVIKTKEPVPNMPGMTIERDIGHATFNEMTGQATVSCSDLKYAIAFETLKNMAYTAETDEAPAVFTRGANGKDWVVNMHKAISMVVNEARKIEFFALPAVIINEEPILE